MTQPFLAVHTDVTDETTQRTSQAVLSGQNVLITQDQQRQSFDTIRTTITPNPYAQKVSFNSYQTPTPSSFSCPLNLGNGHAPNIYPTNFPIRAEKRFVPGGVSFIFKPQQQFEPFRFDQFVCQPNTVFSSLGQHPQQLGQSLAWQPASLQQEIMLAELRKHGLETLKYQQQMQNQPFQLQFHNDQGTTTSDYFRSCAGGSQLGGGLPDFSNVAAATSNGIYMDSSYNRNCCPCSPCYDSSLGRNNIPCSQPINNFPPPTGVSPKPRQLIVKPNLDDSHQTMNVFEDLANSQTSTPKSFFMEDPPHSTKLENSDVQPKETTTPTVKPEDSPQRKNEKTPIERKYSYESIPRGLQSEAQPLVEAHKKEEQNKELKPMKVSFSNDSTNVPIIEDPTESIPESSSKSGKNNKPEKKKPSKKKGRRWDKRSKKEKNSLSSTTSSSFSEEEKTFSPTDTEKESRD